MINSCSAPYELVSFSPGAILYHQEDSALFWYSVQNGIVRVCRFYPDGQRQVLGFYFPGDALGIDEGRYQASAEAVTAVTVNRYRHETNILEGSEANHDRALLWRALKSADNSLHVLGRKAAVERVAAFVLRLADRQADNGNVCLPMSRADIADHLGMTMETASRSFSDLARRGLVAFKSPRLIHILDRPRLRALAGEGEEPAGAMLFNQNQVA